MVENLASARGEISRCEPESRLSQQSFQPYTGNIQSELELFKNNDVTFWILSGLIEI